MTRSEGIIQRRCNNRRFLCSNARQWNMTEIGAQRIHFFSANTDTSARKTQYATIDMSCSIDNDRLAKT
jgi:hypothetical protein